MNRSVTRPVLRSLLLAALVGCSGWVQAQELSLPAAINNSIWLASASQRITRAYTQIALNVVPDRGQKVRSFAAGVIAKNSAELAAVAPKYTHDNSFVGMDGRFKQFLTLVDGTPDTKNLKAINDQAEALMGEAMRMSQALEKVGGGKSKVVASAARVRMYSQRLAKLYLLEQAGTLKSDAEIARLRTEVGNELKFLQSAPISTPQIQNNVDLLAQQWVFMDKAVSSPKSDTVMRDVATTSDRMFDLAHQLAGQYETALSAIN
ncbi:hypothetical protein [Ottowia testudinis]|uniref:PilJ/NarX-like methyl-accepting chemotaxis transducer n=1 Tax=Ottowia testudinis TaxID=2816950 RepID=A0A975CGT9_9BURK|nr:hypothetical protein [Ottowia testudinis]QTD45531.1 hypothetical protein J1M35_00960 [Ottowia testudinis]